MGILERIRATVIACPRAIGCAARTKQRSAMCTDAEFGRQECERYVSATAGLNASPADCCEAAGRRAGKALNGSVCVVRILSITFLWTKVKDLLDYKRIVDLHVNDTLSIHDFDPFVCDTFPHLFTKPRVIN